MDLSGMEEPAFCLLIRIILKSDSPPKMRDVFTYIQNHQKYLSLNFGRWLLILYSAYIHKHGFPQFHLVGSLSEGELLNISTHLLPLPLGFMNLHNAKIIVNISYIKLINRMKIFQSTQKMKRIVLCLLWQILSNYCHMG